MNSAKLHQVVETWSPWAKLPSRARNALRNVWRRCGFSAELATLLRYEVDMALLQVWCVLSLRYRRQIRSFRGRDGMRVHLGCGNTLKPGWINVDCYPPRPEDGCEILVTDMRRGLPFPDRSVQAIYSEHFFEHVPIETTRAVLLRECFRILAPGGVIRVGVPDGELWIDGYLAHRATGEAPELMAGHPTLMMSLNSIARDTTHAFLWDYATLRWAFAEAGFVDLHQSRAGHTREAPFNSMDQTDPWRVAQTVYIEGRRPVK